MANVSHQGQYLSPMDQQEQNARKAFLEDIQAAQIKHGFMIVVDQPPPTLKFVRSQVPSNQKARSPWYKRILPFLNY